MAAWQGPGLQAERLIRGRGPCTCYVPKAVQRLRHDLDADWRAGTRTAADTCHAGGGHGGHGGHGGDALSSAPSSPSSSSRTGVWGAKRDKRETSHDMDMSKRGCRIRVKPGGKCKWRWTWMEMGMGMDANGRVHVGWVGAAERERGSAGVGVGLDVFLAGGSRCRAGRLWKSMEGCPRGRRLSRRHVHWDGDCECD
jgi:hypothetical protein